MKIIFLTPWYPDNAIPSHGIFIYEQAKALSEKHNVVVISSKVNYTKQHLSKYKIETTCVNKNFVEHRIELHQSLPIFNQLHYLWVTIRVAYQVSKKFKPDIIHGNISYPGGIWAMGLSWLIKKPYVVTEHTRFVNYGRSKLYLWLAKQCIKYANRVLTVSRSSADEITKFVKRPIDIVPNIARVEDFHIHPYPNGKITFGFLGSLHSKNHSKGLNILLEALLKIQTDYMLLIGGDGIMKKEYEAFVAKHQLQNRVQFLGVISYEQVQSLMHQLHFFVNPSLYETFGIANVEALACGLPVIAFAGHGASDYLDDTCSIQVTEKNSTALASAIQHMMETYTQYNREKIKAKTQLFSAQHFLNKIESIYSEVLKQKN